jgi:hypothetical protein
MSDINISNRLKNILSHDFVNRLVTSGDLADLAAFIETSIKLRTASGQFIGPAPKMYKSASHAKKRAVKGLQTGHVDMFFSGETLDAIKSQLSDAAGNPTVQVGYIVGKSEQRALQIAEFHNVSGAGKKRVIRRFIGLTDDERKKIINMINNKIAARLP